MYSLFNNSGKIEKLTEADLKIGQIFFLNGYGQDQHSHQRKAVYEIIEGEGGRKFKWVNLDKPERGVKHAIEIRHISKLFGIGTYYMDDQFCTPDEITDALAAAMEAERVEAVQKEVAKIAADENQKFLSQYQRADRRKTTTLIKKYILANFPAVSKVEVRSDVFSGGDSMDVTYYAPEEIKDLESWIKNFQEGHFNGMEDIYEYDSKKQPIILEGFILQTYKYVSDIFKKSDEVREVKEVKQETKKEEVKNNAGQDLSFQLVDYSEKAVAVFGSTAAIKDQLSNLGGRFNKFLTLNGQRAAGWIFSKKKKEALEALIQSVMA